MIAVVVVEDQPELADALRETIEFDGTASVVGVCHTLGESLEVIATLQPAVIVSDFRLPDGDSADVIPAWLESSPSSKVLVVSAWTDQRSVARARQAGARIYLEKGPQLSSLPDAIAEMVAEGGMVFPPRSRRPPSGPPIRSAGELVELLASGVATTVAADRLGVGERDVRRYLNVLRRLHGVHTRAELRASMSRMTVS